MRLPLLFVFLLLGTFTIAQTTSKPKPDNTTQSWLSYTDTATGISVKYPPTWRLKTTNPKSPIVLHSPSNGEDDAFSENINFIVRPLPQGQNVLLADIATTIRNSLTNVVDDFNLESEKKVQWMGTNAIEFIYTGISKGANAGEKVRLLQRCTLLKGYLYLSTYTALNSMLDVNEADAVKIINRTSLKK